MAVKTPDDAVDDDLDPVVVIHALEGAHDDQKEHGQHDETQAVARPKDQKRCENAFPDGDACFVGQRHVTLVVRDFLPVHDSRLIGALRDHVGQHDGDRHQHKKKD